MIFSLISGETDCIFPKLENKLALVVPNFQDSLPNNSWAGKVARASTAHAEFTGWWAYPRHCADLPARLPPLVHLARQQEPCSADGVVLRLWGSQA